ncbi:type II secretion system inner membrane protein GspF [Luminiphilus sp.]|nr:type II secretion system inner membrane protein GspF [Luminiphilus sp.]
MSAFRYKALNTEGRLIKGVLEADSERHLRAQLRAQNLRPVEVRGVEVKMTKGRSPRFTLFRAGLSASELALITRQLATLVASALPLDECLQAAAEQTRKASIKSILLEVRSRVSEGYTLASGMAQYPQAFGEMYRAMVHAGEQAGQLAPVLEQLAEHTENRQLTAQKLKLAMIYPFVLMGVAVSVVAALMVFVVPELVGIFTHTKKELPPLTVGLIATSDFLRDWGLYLLMGLLLSVVVIRQLLQEPRRRLRWHQLLLQIPGINSVLVGIDTARFSSTLSILMGSGVPLLDALHIAGSVMSNRELQKAAIKVADNVQEGSSLNKALSQGDCFPPMMVHMVASGEVSGELEVMLERSAINQERELEMTLGTVMGLFEPMMVILMGGVVLIIVLAILLPIFDLNTMVR